MNTVLKISDKVILSLARRPPGEGRAWLAQQLGISRPTLNARLQSNSFTNDEITRLQELGLL